MPDIKIISLRNGFRRCGIEHPTGPVIHPEGTFTKAQIKKLKAEPMLVVEEVEAKKDKNGTGGAGTGGGN